MRYLIELTLQSEHGIVRFDAVLFYLTNEVFFQPVLFVLLLEGVLYLFAFCLTFFSFFFFPLICELFQGFTYPFVISVSIKLRLA